MRKSEEEGRKSQGTKRSDDGVRLSKPKKDGDSRSGGERKARPALTDPRGLERYSLPVDESSRDKKRKTLKKSISDSERARLAASRHARSKSREDMAVVMPFQEPIEDSGDQVRDRASSDPKAMARPTRKFAIKARKPSPDLSSDSETTSSSVTSSSDESSEENPVKPSKPTRTRPTSEDLAGRHINPLPQGKQYAPKSKAQPDSQDEKSKEKAHEIAQLKEDGKRLDKLTKNLAPNTASATGRNSSNLRNSDPPPQGHVLALSEVVPASVRDSLAMQFMDAIVDAKSPADLVHALPGPVAQHAQYLVMRQRMMKGIWHQIFGGYDGIVMPAHNFEVRVLLQRPVENKAKIISHLTRERLGKVSGNRETVFDFLTGNSGIAKEFVECRGSYQLLVLKSISAAQAIGDSTRRLLDIKKRIHSVIGDKKWTEYSRTNGYLNVIDESLKAYTPENAVYVMKLIGDGRYNKVVAATVFTSSAMARFFIEQYKQEFNDNEDRLKSSYVSVEGLLERLVKLDVIEESESYEEDEERNMQYVATLDFHAMMYIVYDVWDHVIKEQLTKPGNRIKSINDIHPVKLTEQTLNMLSALMQYMVERREVDEDFYFDEDLVSHVVEEFRSLISKNLTSASFFSRVFGYLNVTQSNLAFASVTSRTLLHQLRFFGQSYIDSQADYGKLDYLIRKRFEKLIDEMRGGKFPSVSLFQILLCELGLADQTAVGVMTEDAGDQLARQVLHAGFGSMFQYLEIVEVFKKGGRHYDRSKGKQPQKVTKQDVIKHYKAMFDREDVSPDFDNITSIPRSFFLKVLRDTYDSYNRNLPSQYRSLEVTQEIGSSLMDLLSRLPDMEGDFSEEFMSSFVTVLYEFGVIGVVSMKDMKEGAYYGLIKEVIKEYIKVSNAQGIYKLENSLKAIAQDKERGDYEKRAAQVELRKKYSQKISADLQDGVFIAQKFFRTVYEVSVTGDPLMDRHQKVEDRELSNIMNIIGTDIGSHAGVKASKVEQRMVGLFVTISKTLVNYLIDRFMPNKQYTGIYMALMNLHGFKYVEYLVQRMISEYQKKVVKEDEKYAAVFEQFKANISDLFNTGYISPNVSENGDIMADQDIECSASMNGYIRILSAAMRNLSVFIEPNLQDERKVGEGEFLNTSQKLEIIKRKEKIALSKIQPQDRAAIAIAIFNALSEQFMIPEATGALPVKFQHTAISNIAENISLAIFDELTLQPNGTYWLNINPENLKEIVNGCLKRYIKANDKIKEKIRTQRRENLSGEGSDLSNEDLRMRPLEETPKSAPDRWRSAASKIKIVGRLGFTQSTPPESSPPEHKQPEGGFLDVDTAERMKALGLSLSPEKLRRGVPSLKKTANTSTVSIRTSFTGNSMVSHLPANRRPPRPSQEELNKEIKDRGTQ